MGMNTFVTSGTTQYDAFGGGEHALCPGGDVPGNKRRWITSTQECVSGGAATPYSQNAIFIENVGASGLIYYFYATNTSKIDADEPSCLALDAYDLSSHKWRGEYIFPRGSGPPYSTTYNSEVFAIVDEENSFNEDCALAEMHCVISFDLDRDNYLWGTVGGHVTIDSNGGWNPYYCIKSTSPIDEDFSYSTNSSWTNKGAICPNGGVANDKGAYAKIHTCRCSCHDNWYMVAYRLKGTTGDWIISYSPNSGTTWYSGATFADGTTKEGSHSYTAYNFYHDDYNDKTLFFNCGYPGYLGKGFTYMDCIRCSSNTGAFSSKVSIADAASRPKGKETYSGSTWPVDYPDDLPEYDEANASIGSNMHAANHMVDNNVVYRMTGFYGCDGTAGGYPYANNVYKNSSLSLIWKEFGDNSYWKSSQIFTIPSDADYRLNTTIMDIDIISGTNNDRYMIANLLKLYDDGTKCNSIAYSSEPFSGNNWTVYDISPKVVNQGTCYHIWVNRKRDFSAIGAMTSGNNTNGAEEDMYAEGFVSWLDNRVISESQVESLNNIYTIGTGKIYTIGDGLLHII